MTESTIASETRSKRPHRLGTPACWASIHRASAGSAADCHPPADSLRLGHFAQDGRDVQMFGIRKGTDLLRDLRERHVDEDQALHFVGHQANLRMLEAVAKRCKMGTTTTTSRASATPAGPAGPW